MSLLETDDLAARWSELLVGQNDVIESVVPFVRAHQAGLGPEERPMGIFLLAGPTGSGKTRAAESLAQILHGSRRNYLRVDCGEYQMEHQVAKLVGAPPGYLGHRETSPLFTQSRLNAVASTESDISILLFDEVEKAHSALHRLLLGVLDKGRLSLGDNSTVNFERSLVFMTSNLGAKQMELATTNRYTFAGTINNTPSEAATQSIAMNAVKAKFAPEFINRIDKVVTYRYLSRDSYRKVAQMFIRDQNHFILRRLGIRAFSLSYTKAGEEFLLNKGTSNERGARELKRTLDKYLFQPVAALAAAGRINPRDEVIFDAHGDDTRLYAKLVEEERKRKLA